MFEDDDATFAQRRKRLTRQVKTEKGRLVIELDAEAVEAYVRDQLDAQLRAAITFNVEQVARQQLNTHTKHAAHRAVQEWLKSRQVFDAAYKAVAAWLDDREGWAAKQLRKGGARIAAGSKVD